MPDDEEATLPEPGASEGNAASTPAPTDPVVADHNDRGLELARSIARGLAGKTRARAKPSAWLRGRPARVEPTLSDDRDPQLLDQTLGRLFEERGWTEDLRVHGAVARWEGIVGSSVAAHVIAEAYEDGVLRVAADSTAWATEMKLLAPQLVRRLNEELGEGTITAIEVRGPQAPSWSRGRYRVKGRGPRDTYG